MDSQQCGCPLCAVRSLMPPAEEGKDRTPSIIGIDVSTRRIALAVIPTMGILDDITVFQFDLRSKSMPAKCGEAADGCLTIIATIHEAVDVTSIAIEQPVGFGGKIIPLVGAITGAFPGGNVVWYAPSTWQSLIRKATHVSGDPNIKIKQRIHNALADALPGADKYWEHISEDQRDAIAIALAHRIETLEATGLSEYDQQWLDTIGGAG